MDNNIGITLGTNADMETPRNNVAGILSGSSLYPNARIVKLEELGAGEYFNGLIYVKKSSYRKNKFNDSYDLRMYCVDGDGIIFTATCFNTKSRDVVENNIVFVEKGMKVENFTGGIFYNIDKLMVYGGTDIPITAFIKEIDNKDVYLREYETLVSRLETNNPAYGRLMVELNKHLNYKQVLQVSPYKQMLGNRLGSALRVMVETINAYMNINSLVVKKEESDIDLFILISMLYFVQPTIESYNMFHGSSFTTEHSEDLKLPIEPFLMNIIYQSSISREDKTKIISILMERNNFDLYKKIKGKFPMETMFFSTLGVIETAISVEE